MGKWPAAATATGLAAAGHLSTAVVIADLRVGFGRQTSTKTEDRTMTDAMMSLRTLLEKSSDADLLREMVGFAAQRLMELEVESLTGAAHGERSPDRINHRNGYRDRIWGLTWRIY